MHHLSLGVVRFAHTRFVCRGCVPPLARRRALRAHAIRLSRLRATSRSASCATRTRDSSVAVACHLSLGVARFAHTRFVCRRIAHKTTKDASFHAGMEMRPSLFFRRAGSSLDHIAVIYSRSSQRLSTSAWNCSIRCSLPGLNRCLNRPCARRKSSIGSFFFGS